MPNAAAEPARVRVLGPIRVADGTGRMVEPTGGRLKALVAALVVLPRHAGEAVAAATLIDDLWGDEPPRDGKGALQTLVSRLRRVAPGLVVSSAAGYALGEPADSVDLLRAAGIAASADRADLGVLDEALALWHGEPGADLGDAPVATALAARAAETRSELLRLRADRHAADGAFDLALRDLDSLLDQHPLDEHLRRRQLEWLAAAGRAAEATAAFAAFRERLADDLGTSPGAGLLAVNARLLREGAAEEERVAAPAASRTRVGVRAAPNPLIGRDDDLRRIESLLDRHRLVTVLGAGGLGKTRLAQAVAGASTAPGVIVVELASIRADDDVALALSTTLGVRESGTTTRLAAEVRAPDLRRRIVEQLSERPTLLVLDNCEQVVDGAARWAAELIAAVPTLRILATSRSPLVIGAERVYQLEPLPSGSAGTLESAGGPAVRLFLERARAVRPNAELPVDAVARLCDRLDGLPLAIELAAARVRSMTVDQIAQRLDDRFALLSSGDRSAPERQRTLLAVIEWSWALLTPAEQRGLLRLSWFVDGFGPEAAESLVAPDDALAVVDGLVGHSLLGVTEDAAGRVRYRMLETVREFGLLRLESAPEESAAVAAAIDEWAVRVGRRTALDLRGSEQLAALDTLTLEEDNLVAVLRRAIDRGDGAVVFEVFAALGLFWTMRTAHTEVLAFGDAVLEATRRTRVTDDSAPAAMLALVLVALTHLAIQAYSGLRALARLRVLAARQWPLPPWLDALAGLLRDLPDFDAAGARLEAMMTSPDDGTALVGNLMRSQFAENDGDPETAIDCARRAHTRAVRIGDVWARATSSMMLAQLEAQSGRPETAIPWALEAREELVRLGADADVLQVDWTIAVCDLSLGRTDAAGPVLRAQATEEHATTDGIEFARIAGLGLVELERIEGRTSVALDEAVRLLDEFSRSGLRTSPWFLLALATLIAGGAESGWPRATLTAWADALHRRATALLRLRADYIDRPILGTITAGWAAWAAGDPPLEDDAVLALALAGSLRARQDLPALHLDRIARSAVASIGERIGGPDGEATALARLDAARAAVAAMTPEAQRRRAGDLLARPVSAC